MNNEFITTASSAPPLLLTLGVYVVAINIVTFFAFGIDKYKSTKTNRRRIPEKTLWLLSLLGGSIGGLIAMEFFRHKTKKISFQVIEVLIFLVQLSLVVLYFVYN